MSDRRDIRRPHPPPDHIQAQLANGEPDWDVETPPLGTLSGPAATAAAVHRINDRTKEVLVSSRQTADRVDQISAGFRAMGQRVGEIATQVGELQRSTGNLEGKLDVLAEVIGEERRERRQLHVAAATAQIHVDHEAAVTQIQVAKTDRIAAIEERKHRAAHRRRITMRVIATAGAALALLEAVLLSGRC